MTKEEAISIISGYEAYGCGYCLQGGDEVEEALSLAIDALKQEPVRHGKWFVRRYGCCGELVIDCSACNESTFSLMPFETLVRGFKYCPNCGAKMDERKE